MNEQTNLQDSPAETSLIYDTSTVYLPTLDVKSLPSLASDVRFIAGMPVVVDLGTANPTVLRLTEKSKLRDETTGFKIVEQLCREMGWDLTVSDSRNTLVEIRFNGQPVRAGSDGTNYLVSVAWTHCNWQFIWNSLLDLIELSTIPYT